MRQMLFNLSANDLVNNSGMCCTITIPGQSGGIFSRKVRIALVPPVDAPITIILSVVSFICTWFGDRDNMLSADSFGEISDEQVYDV